MLYVSFPNDNTIIDYGDEVEIEQKQEDFIQDLLNILPETFERFNLFPRIKLRNGFIVQINFSNLNLKQLPKSIRHLYKLRFLDLRNNKLSSLPKEIIYLQNLVELTLGGNNLETLPEEIGDLKTLKLLSIEGNYLKSLPYSIGFLKSLRSLNMYKNELQNLPGTIGFLENLVNLDVAENKLHKLPDSILWIPKLNRLTVYKNNIQQIQASIEEKVKNDKYLYWDWSQNPGEYRSESYPFLKGGIYLTPSVDVKSHTKWIFLQKKDEKTGKLIAEDKVWVNQIESDKECLSQEILDGFKDIVKEMAGDGMNLFKRRSYYEKNLPCAIPITYTLKLSLKSVRDHNMPGRSIWLNPKP